MQNTFPPSSTAATPRPTEDLFTWPLSLFSSLSVFLQIFTFMYANRLFPLSLFQQ